jgi:pyridoxamine--pyruvate transaminase
MRQPDFTLTAGPTMASHRVLAALGSPVIYDYDPAFLARFRETEEMLQRAYRTSGDVVLMQGEAVLGLEAAARGLVTPGMRCLNLVSGVYAAWFGDWLRQYGAEVVEVRVPYDEAIDPSAVASALDRDGPFALVAIVHSETPSGVENPLGEIAPLVHAHGALMLADVVSSLGGSELAIDDWHVDLAVAGPQKCLAGPPGMSLVCVSARAWEAMEANPTAPRGSFLSLLDWKHTWIDGGRVAFPYTPSVSDLNGVHAALAELLDDGLEATIAQHDLAARATRAGVLGLGLELWPRSETYAAHCVTAVRIPAGTAVPALLGHVRERYGVMLSGGHGELKEKLVRLGHMGPAARSLYPLIAVSALGRGLADLGVAADVGAGAQATMSVLSEGPL